MKKLSFIVIAYNEEKHILTTLESILNQNGLSDYEIIVVNDGSKDKTSKLVHEFAIKHKYIKLISYKINRGRGFARHIGMRDGKGKYIAFIDADIILPKDWLEKVLLQMKHYDGVGGIAIPDGDSMYVCQKFNLCPKPSPATTGITGNNVIYKKSIFNQIKLNPNLRGGEDTDINWRMTEAGYKLRLINNLIVTHKENITFKRSLKRMFSYGKGATNLLNMHKKIRVPDISFFLFILLLINTIYFLLNRNLYFIPLVVIYPLFVSYLHLSKKFKLVKVADFVYAGLVNYFMIFFYFLGRLVGYFSKE